MKNVSSILWKKLNGLFGQPNTYTENPPPQRVCTWGEILCRCLLEIFINFKNSHLHSMKRIISKRKECIILQTDKWNGGENKESINI